MYQMKNTTEDEKIKDKLSDEDKTVITETIKTTQEWFDEHDSEEASVYDDKYKEIETIFMPIMTKLYQQEAKRNKIKTNYSYEEYLKNLSLKMFFSNGKNFELKDYAHIHDPNIPGSNKFVVFIKNLFPKFRGTLKYFVFKLNERLLKRFFK